ncbi:protein WEAK CHLOROPLAST MOVEMENT UNDER BLUE LIGHT 1-like isoform X2 [Andrographis paniculata]|nr:protein WEAK CHLOROPLAST MOVEMENT UNDER BLUE LIGHT 1-like isoform X2 [Andrographis paniculata]XP_051124442.1 protein WEAK CHLOROPLAST MOVEMENT UNDER BLUE LIGHT 1-like isoform X2 [Andrographis paniculata]XP_051124443.1 protein WEAK CHLOROPLAST MOVEMENT UNDER BLUE LIGHT 1-like isoform X2 [Andrographis paniculata]
MDDAQNETGNVPQGSSPAQKISSPADDQSGVAVSPARKINGEMNASEPAARENPVRNPQVEDNGMGASVKDLPMPVVAGDSSLTTQENRQSLESVNGAIHAESILSSTLETKQDNASSRSAREKENSDGHDHLTAKAATNSDQKLSNIDTAAPFESVKAAVSKFGGIVDWKAHRALTVEKRKVMEQELGRAQEEIPLYKKRSENAEEAKLEVLKELENTKAQIEELKLSLERVQKEEEQAKQDCELAELRVAEMKQGIADEASIAAKAQIEVSRARHEAAVSELKSVKDELEQLKKDHSLLLAEKDESIKKMEQAISTSKEIEKSVEDLTIELITAKESLESAHAAHLEAEEHRIGAVMAKEENILNWEKELKQTEEELEKASQQLLATKDLKSKLDSAKALLQDLKGELTAYMDSKPEQGNAEEGNFNDALKEPRKGTRRNVEAALSAAKKELEQVNNNIEKATNEVNQLTDAASSLKSEIEKEKAELASIQQREGMASIAVSSLEAELSKTESEISVAQAQEKEQREKFADLPKQLQAVAQEADRAKELEKIACDELKRAREEAEQAKAGASTMESRLRAVQKEIEAAKVSEKLAMAAVNALVESESANAEDSPTRVALSLDEYYELSKKAQEAEEQANIRVATALSEIEVAKESELESLHRLEEANRELAERRDALQDALHKSEKADEGKLGAEQELRKWRAENEERRKAGDSIATSKTSNVSPKDSFEERLETMNPVNAPHSSASQLSSTPGSYSSGAQSSDVQLQVKVPKKKKRSIFPRIFMFLSKKKPQSSKS